MTKDINKELEKLERYRNLFKLIISQPDQTLEYSTDELRYYYYTIEDIEEKKNFKPFLIYTDPDPKDICKNINFDAYNNIKYPVFSLLVIAQLDEYKCRTKIFYDLLTCYSVDKSQPAIHEQLFGKDFVVDLVDDKCTSIKKLDGTKHNYELLKIYKLDNNDSFIKAYDKSLNDIAAGKQYKAGVSAEPCIIKPLPDGTPDLSDSIDSGPCIIQKDKDGNPFIKTDLTNKENK